MPGLISHYVCGDVVLNKLLYEKRSLLKNYRQIYNVGTQGPDIFFYYLPALFKKNMKNIGSIMHKNNVGKYMDMMITNIDSLKGEEKEKAVAYMSGYITHYCFDCHAHPYIYYKTGISDDANTIKAIRHSMYHRNFETAIDVCILKLLNSQKPSEIKLWKLIRINKYDILTISELISKALYDTYEINISKKQVYKAMAHMAGITRIMQSKTGKRKKLMGFVEQKTIGDKLFSALIHMQEINDGIDYLNVKKEKWYKPWDNKEHITYSFMDLFQNAVDESIIMINALFEYKNHEISKEKLIKIIGSRSLLSGIDSDNEVSFKYFDVVYKQNKKDK